MIMNKYEQFLGHLEHELEKTDVIIERFKELFSEKLKKKKDRTRIEEIEGELKLKKIELDYLEEKAIEERKPYSMVNPDGLIEMVKDMIYNLEKELKKEKGE